MKGLISRKVLAVVVLLGMLCVPLRGYAEEEQKKSDADSQQQQGSSTDEQTDDTQGQSFQEYLRMLQEANQ